MIKNILLTNDDGIDAPGILALAASLGGDYDVTVCAPDNERSASGHAVSLHKAVSYSRRTMSGAKNAFAIGGTPADCVKLGISRFMGAPPDIVVSGINYGQNLGTDVFYSGTVSAAMEAVINGFKGIAVSCALRGGNEPLYEMAATFIARNIEVFLQAEHGFYNINFPGCKADEVAGIVQAPLAKIRYSDRHEVQGNDENGTITAFPSRLIMESESKSDIYYCYKNYVTVTPLMYDITDNAALSCDIAYGQLKL